MSMMALGELGYRDGTGKERKDDARKFVQRKFQQHIINEWLQRCECFCHP